MYIKNPVRRAVAAAALATSAAIAVGAVGAGADSSITPDSGSTDMATGRDVGDAPPGSARAGGARMGVTVARHYEVVDGDSFWGIAERQLPDDATAGDVLKVATALMAYNAPRLGYGDPAMLRPGDVVDTVSAAPVPAAAQMARPARNEASVAPASHEVIAGDSYWAIAESILGDEATPADVLEKTDALIALNSPRLGYEDSQMLHPGDVVYLEDPASTEVVIDSGSSDEVADPEVAGPNVSEPSKGTTSMPSAPPKTTEGATSWNWPLATQYRAERWNWPLATQYRAERPQTPTSPPHSEVALIAWETISPLHPATFGGEPTGKLTGEGRDELHRGGDRPSAPRSPAAPYYASAS
jgi:LysM domain